MASGKPQDFFVKEGSHVAVGDYKPLKEGFRPTGGTPPSGAAEHRSGTVTGTANDRDSSQIRPPSQDRP